MIEVQWCGFCRMDTAGNHERSCPNATTRTIDLTAEPNASSMSFSTSSSQILCPDLLRLSDIGEADGWRGHVVRGFFRVLKVVSGL